jgi:hypothetical protein
MVRKYALSVAGWLLHMKEKDMKNPSKANTEELRPEYDFDYSKAVRGKYYQRLIVEGSNVVILDPDIAKSFHDSTAVNEALRSLLELTNTTRRLTRGVAKGKK